MDAKEFHRQLEQVLRQKDPAALRQFLIAQEQWPQDTTMDAERAMWTMILGRPALAPLHPEAQAWLMAHGHAEDAALLQRNQAQPKTKGTPSAKTKHPQHKRERKPDGAPKSKHPSEERKA